MPSANANAFPIATVVKRLRKAIQPFPRAALGDLRDRGHGSVFEILVACMISIRTKDEVTLPTALHLFQKASSPMEMVQLSVQEIDVLIQGCAFHETKAQQILAIAEQAVAHHDGILPCSAEILLSFNGVGPKCANLVLGIACGQPWIGVDSHVHRIVNRWGYVSTTTPEKTMVALEQTLPKKYWIEINELLVPFGKNICTPGRPKCSQCNMVDLCPRVGVAGSR